MSATKTFKGRIQLKHDTEVNWNKATGFIPNQGEIIVYDIDEAYSYERFKIGDGVQNVVALPFTTVQADLAVEDETSPAYVKNQPTSEDITQLFMELDVLQPMADENGVVLTNTDGKIFTL